MQAAEAGIEAQFSKEGLPPESNSADECVKIVWSQLFAQERCYNPDFFGSEKPGRAAAEQLWDILT